MKVDPLVGARWKVWRAKQHFELLAEQGKEWIGDHGYKIERASDDKLTEHTLTVTYDPSPPYAQWALIIGDCAHNLRSALDHTVYQLGYLVPGADEDKPPPRADQLAFPICSNAKWFASSSQRALPDFPAAVVDAVEALQPYNRPDKNAPAWLDILRRLDDWDKHRVLAPVASTSDGLRGTFRNVNGTINTMETRVVGLDTSSDPVAIITVTTTEPSPDLTMDFGRSLLVALADFPPPEVGGLGAAGVLLEIGNEVRRCMLELRHFLDGDAEAI